MPGILLNRLSRPKEGELPEDQLAKGRAILTGEMLPVISPNAVEGEHYIYLEDIVSRLQAHQEGNLLDRALTLMRQGRCDWLAVTEVSRLTGDLTVAGEILALCRQYRIPLYTRERLRIPYEPWRPESEQELFILFFMSGLEVIGYRGRIQRAFAAAYPVDSQTGESRLQTFEGLGRHMNGKVPRGYVWNKQTKEPEPDKTIPFPDYVPEGHTRPPALTWWEIVRHARELGRQYGCYEASRRLQLATGAPIDPNELVYIWRNPFYAGRPTSRMARRAGRMVKREEPVSTIGRYPAMETWEEHCDLQAILEERGTRGLKSASGKWASGLIRCACGQPWVGWGRYYRCRGHFRAANVRAEAGRRQRDPGLIRKDRHTVPEGWEPTPTCGMAYKERIHELVEGHLRTLFARPDLVAVIARYAAQQQETNVSRAHLSRQEEQLVRERERLDKRRQETIDLHLDGTLTRAELDDRLHRMGKEKGGVEARLAQVREALATPLVPSAALQALQKVVTLDFDDFWTSDALSDNERALIARAFLEHIPVTGSKNQKEYGSPVYSALLRED